VDARRAVFSGAMARCIYVASVRQRRDTDVPGVARGAAVKSGLHNFLHFLLPGEALMDFGVG
jgi:hypothetical protein